MMRKDLLVFGVMVSCLLALATVESADAHRINVFAWVEGRTVHTESFFSDGTKAANAQIQVFGSDGALLLEGTTDREGVYVFDTPAVTDLKVVLNESMGHRAEYYLRANEFGDRTGIPSASAKSRHEAHTGFEEAPKEEHDHSHPNRHDHQDGVTDEEIRIIMASVLDEKLSPIRAKLASLEQKGPNLSQIIGGLGYIIGLMGTALYFKSRR